METDHEDADVEDLFNKTVEIASSIHTICVKLVGVYCTILFSKLVLVLIRSLCRSYNFLEQEEEDNEKIRALFSLTILQITVNTLVQSISSFFFWCFFSSPLL